MLGLDDGSTAYRAKAAGFFYELSSNSILSLFCPGNPFPAGTRPPSSGAYADGVYIILAPLSVGVRGIHFSAQASGVTQEVTYTVIVTPESIPGTPDDRVAGLGYAVTRLSFRANTRRLDATVPNAPPDATLNDQPRC